jgi:hypothetical protein
VGYISCHVASQLVSLTRLSSQAVEVPGECFRQLEVLTTLTGLQRVQIHCRTSFIPWLGRLTHLKHLGWACASLHERYLVDQSPLTHLQKLVHLKIGPEYARWGPDHLRVVGKIITLASLDLDGSSSPFVAPDAIALTPLSRLTAVRLNCNVKVCLLERSVAMLQELALLEEGQLGEACLSVLQWASGLRKLELDYASGICDSRDSGVRPSRLCQGLSRMSRLQELSLGVDPHWVQSCFGAIGVLKVLTRLEWYGGLLTTADVLACTRLKRLRVLGLFPHPDARRCVRFSAFLAVAMLPELTKLDMSSLTGISAYQLTDAINMRLNAELHSRGWPPLNLSLGWSYPKGYYVLQ